MKKRLQLCLSLACFWALGTSHVMGNDSSTHHKTSLFSKLESTSFLTNCHLMRVWRVALPVTKNTFNERFGGDADQRPGLLEEGREVAQRALCTRGLLLSGGRPRPTHRLQLRSAVRCQSSLYLRIQQE